MASNDGEQPNEKDQNQWIKPPAVFKAAIWKHFRMSKDRPKTMCIYCQSEMAYANGNTSSMKRHIARQHPTIDLKEYKPASIFKTEKKVDSTENEKEQTANENKQKAADFFGKIPKGSARDVRITNAIMEYIIKGLR